jgi:hypothetical protein
MGAITQDTVITGATISLTLGINTTILGIEEGLGREITIRGVTLTSKVKEKLSQNLTPSIVLEEASLTTTNLGVSRLLNILLLLSRSAGTSRC